MNEDTDGASMAICAILPPQPHGCICPPGAEAGCQGAACPRRPSQRADRVRELLEANTREVERRRAVEAERDALLATVSDAAAEVAEQLKAAIAIEGDRDRYAAALRLIRDAHVPDQPATTDMSERDWVMRHVAAMRSVATLALDMGLEPVEHGRDAE